MVQIKKETVTKTFRGNNILVETIKEFHYSTEEERMKHKALMVADGYRSNGQIQENIGTIMQPKHVWFGGYYKREVESKDIEDNKMNPFSGINSSITADVETRSKR